VGLERELSFFFSRLAGETLVNTFAAELVKHLDFRAPTRRFLSWKS
jgi:hypothetical protein